VYTSVSLKAAPADHLGSIHMSGKDKRDPKSEPRSGQNKRDPDHVGVPQLMEVICGLKKERYPFERYVALMTFGVWLRIPKEEDYVQRSELISAASIILAINNGTLRVPSAKKRSVIEQIAKPLFSTLEVADALVNRFVIDADPVTDASFIATFIARCPKEFNPSVNKALFFMKNGGFTEDFSDQGDDTPVKMAPATLKPGWTSCAASSPFVVAARRLKLSEIVELNADDEGVLEAAKILQDVTRLREFFGGARYIQEILVERLHESSIKKIPFVDFPDTIKPHVLEPRPFSSTQLDIIKRYRAPRFSRFDPAIGP
jgi:hypothetical protein